MLNLKQKFQVFVSSTYTDLIEERQAAVSAILKLGHIPAGMELFAAGDQSQMDVIKRWIDDSDIYMLILGGRYGSVEKTTGKSYTELEYEYALSAGKPVFSLVLDDDAIGRKLQESGRSVIEEEHPDKLKAFRAVVLSRMCAICRDNKDIRVGAYDSILEIIQSKPLSGWVPVATVEDTRPLYDEITLLKTENDRLKADRDDAKPATSPNQATARPELAAIKEALAATTLTLPENITDSGRTHASTMHSLFLANGLILVRGWTVARGRTDRLDFFLDNFFPVLQIHRLIRKEGLGPIFTYTTTELGLDYLAKYPPSQSKKTSQPAVVRPSEDNSNQTSSPKPAPKVTSMRTGVARSSSKVAKLKK